MGVFLNVKPDLHTCSVWSHCQPSKPGALRGFHTCFPKHQWQQGGCMLGCCKDGAVGLFSWIYDSLNPRWISHHGSLKAQIIDFSFLTFPLWQDIYGFCKSKIWAQQMVSRRRKCFLCQLHNHTSPKLPFKSFQVFFWGLRWLWWPRQVATALHDKSRMKCFPARLFSKTSSALLCNFQKSKRDL